MELSRRLGGCDSFPVQILLQQPVKNARTAPPRPQAKALLGQNKYGVPRFTDSDFTGNVA